MKKHIPLLILLIISLAIAPLMAKKDRPDAPDFTLKSIDGKEVSLSDFKGKVVYLDIWASWCGPCVREMPASKELHEKMKEEDVVFLYVSVDKNPRAWEQAVTRFGIPGVNLLSVNGSQDGFLRKYGKGSIPHYYLIDKEGRIADADAKRPSQPGTEKAIRKLLEE